MLPKCGLLSILVKSRSAPFDFAQGSRQKSEVVADFFIRYCFGRLGYGNRKTG